MISARPPNAASGSPPPTIFPRMVRSGVTPKSSCAPPRATRKPVMTSSNTRSAPDASQRRRSASRKPGSGGTTPMFPATGSTMIAARPSPYSATVDATASTSLYLHTIVSFVVAGGNAGARRQAERRDTGAGTREQRVDVAVVAACELEDAVARSERAGKARGAHGRLGAGRDEADLLDRGDRVDDLRCELDLGLRRGAEARPALGGIAHRRHRCPDRRDRRARARRTILTPVDVARLLVDVCPRRYAPSPRPTNNGSSSPTARIARTGEFTPPGMSSSARRNNSLRVRRTRVSLPFIILRAKRGPNHQPRKMRSIFRGDQSQVASSFVQ